MKVVCPHCKSINNVPFRDSYLKANCGRCKNSMLEARPIDLTSKDFDEIVTNSDLPVIIDFWAPWCGPCQMMAPAFSKSASNFALKALFAKVNTQDEQTLAARFGIRGIPTIIIFKDSKEVFRTSGALDESKINSLVRGYL